MLQHQLRGLFSVIDDCSFRVSQFDMLSGSDVNWWGATGDDFQNLTNGFIISDSSLNQTYKNDTFVVHLRKNVTWDQIKVLAVWDIPTASDFGHILLSNYSANGGVNLSNIEQPTMFENCKVLSDNYRIRWSFKEGDNVDIGLEAAIGIQNYMGFGWANPNASGSLMVGADVAITGFKEGGIPFADDYYITKNSECMINEDGSVQGVCPDSMYNATSTIGMVNNTRLVYGHRKDGVSFVRYRRPLQSNDNNPYSEGREGCASEVFYTAGHDVALYVTSDPIGGNATLRNTSETIYFGGPEAEGVQASPGEMVWAPDRNTPDLVYYHSLYVPKMGWKVQVVDGGLPDMYNNSVSLDDQQVMLFWTLSENSISIAARGEKKSGYLAIGFGRGMVNSYAYVGWVDDSGKGRVNTYWIDGRDASNVHPTKENLTYVRCKSENGIITLEFTRPLNPSCDPDGRPECNNIVEPSTPLKVIWAMGAQWSDDHLSVGNMHFVTSKRPMSVLLMRGSAEAEEDLRPVLARYLKHVKDDNWFRIHVYLQYSGLAIVFLGFLFAVAELRGLTFDSVHWDETFGERYGDENVHGLSWALIVWLLIGALTVMYLEYHEMKKRRGRILGRSNWVLGNGEEEDVDLLTPSRVMTHKESQSSERMEVQLEPLSR
ncbi:UNVERIFIED_CONTAM: cytochrome, DM13 and DOMON domain-containing protein [Sesamum radiatum]|uniref:Cytochrome, DM13 and DOMON domain-containing protein n=1 Tax=Sesamum radiatum TaxID=300843 RepID=A0AAW2JRV0_SESRA